ncbi:YlxR family protein [Paenibacillus thiaminolyticus]|uniref:YlxR family protein n=1 Tax=Paenibacillus thiaminolyticus TaxID=49283 RepID=A0AAP9DYJ4_PANTH|nr:YlxR family protein [Paenibacillus thiaminolyticus]MCY9537017.1 YlxR family protein [Paenibacillus thiaminolyticus]MCY9603225.1 YlxR family protein [Paenibacillus thiaminolyticus]MCY9608054.1 YlxR family protein [Paenibacillus thiaminolyticus]MCY9613672.1 YlxR family protein [Paenibacillus thiaminolyticus]MCY9618834.1 YlxR family protein [Paenibacillus thiaminolyticus]
MRTRKVPLRKCVACQEMMPKKELIRVVRTPEEEVLIDLTGKKSGRGAYLCGKLSCFKLAHKSRALDRALKHQVQPEIYEQLAQDFIKVEDEFNAMKEKVDDDE